MDSRNRRFILPAYFSIMVLSMLLIVGALYEGASEQLKADQPSADAFRYNANVPFDVKELDRVRRGSVLVRDITFVAVDSPVNAYLVTSTGKGPYAGILYVHWLGEPATTNRAEFLDEAVELGARGVVSLLVDAMWAKPEWYEKRVPEDDYKSSVRQVIELRRAMDLLTSQPGVDTARIAYVGHDFGAMYGAVMGGVDPRPRTYVLMAGTPVFSDWFLYAAQPKDLAAYKQQMSTIDPVKFLPLIKDASLFFQFADSDRYIPEDNAIAFYKAANARKQMATYHANHSLANSDASADRKQWLVRELNLP